jgi:hypothetical protein
MTPSRFLVTLAHRVAHWLLSADPDRVHPLRYKPHGTPHTPEFQEILDGLVERPRCGCRLTISRQQRPEFGSATSP